MNPAGGAVDILAELLDLLDLGGQGVGKGVLEGLSGHVSKSIELPRAVATYLSLRGGVAARAVQGRGLHGPCDRGPQSGGTNAERRSHIDSCRKKQQWVRRWGVYGVYRKEKEDTGRREIEIIRELPGDFSRIFPFGRNTAGTVTVREPVQ